MPQAIAHYGYPLIFILVLLQGEAPVLLGGFLIHQGYFEWLPLLVTAMSATALGEQLYFSLVRWQGKRWSARLSGLSDKLSRADRLLQRYGGAVVLLMRFLYGIRPLLPAMLGLSTIPCWRFALLNLLGALLWAGVFALLGYLAGDAASLLLTELRRLERWVLVAVVSFSLILALVRWHRLWWRRGRGPRQGTDSMPCGQS